MSTSGGFAVVIVVLCAACTAPAGGAAPARMTASGAQAAAAHPAAALICRTERPTGSNIPRRVCYTQEELDEASQAAQDAHRRAIQGGVQGQRD